MIYNLGFYHCKCIRTKLIYLFMSSQFEFSINVFVVFQILLYDLRSNQPLLVKDHNYDLPIKSLHFQPEENLVLSMDSRILRFWNPQTVS